MILVHSSAKEIILLILCTHTIRLFILWVRNGKKCQMYYSEQICNALYLHSPYPHSVDSLVYNCGIKIREATRQKITFVWWISPTWLLWNILDNNFCCINVKKIYVLVKLNICYLIHILLHWRKEWCCSPFVWWPWRWRYIVLAAVFYRDVWEGFCVGNSTGMIIVFLTAILARLQEVRWYFLPHGSILYLSSPAVLSNGRCDYAPAITVTIYYGQWCKAVIEMLQREPLFLICCLSKITKIC